MSKLLSLLALLSFIGSARAQTLGEVRTFATGWFKTTHSMETANFVWDGRRWCKEGSKEAGEALKRIYERYSNSSVRNE